MGASKVAGINFSFINTYTALYNIKSHKIETQLFIDSRDVMLMLYGVKKIIADNKIDKKLYESESTVIYSLIYGKWLGKFTLTVPHQEELYNLIDYNFNDEIDEVYMEDFKRYVSDLIGLKEEDFNKKLKIEDYIERIKPKATELYKANYLLKKWDWRERLKYISGNLFLFDKEEHNFAKIAKSKEFLNIKEVFERKRKNKKRGNFIDSLVLCTLLEKLAAYKKGKRKEIPLFYDNQGLYREVIEAADLVEQFTLVVGDSKMCVLCNHEFMMLHSIFRKETKVKELIEDDDYKKFIEVQKKSEKVSPGEEEEEINAEFLKEVQELKDTKFLQTFWVNSNEEIVELIEDIIESTKQKLRDPEANQILQNEINQIKKNIQQNVINFTILREIYLDIEKAHKKLKSTFDSNIEKYRFERKLNVFNDLSLTRFSLKDEKNCKAVHEISTRLLLHEEGDDFSFVGEIITNVYNLLLKGIESNTGELAVVLSILWVLEDYDAIVRIIENIECVSYNQYAEGFIYTAALAKMYDNEESKKKILNIFAGIQSNVHTDGTKDKFKFDKNYKTAIGASYVYFLMWTKRQDDNFHVTLFEPKAPNPDNEIDSLYIEAVKLAKFCLDALENVYNYKDSSKAHRKAKYYYILNNYIYYVTIGSPNETFLQLDNKVSILKNVAKETSEYSQYRYYDTLSLYSLRLATINKDLNKELYIHYLEESKNYIEIAIDWCIRADDNYDYINLENKITRLILIEDSSLLDKDRKLIKRKNNFKG